MTLSELDVGPLVGHTTADSVRLWGRAPGNGWLLAARIGRGIGPAAIAWESSLVSPTWSDFDYTGIVEFRGLKSSTTYTYQAALIDGFHSIGADDPAWAAIDQTQRVFPTFTTFPAEADLDDQGATHFIFGSCNHEPVRKPPADSLFGKLHAEATKINAIQYLVHQTEKPAFHAMRLLLEKKKIRPDFLLLAGDQVYADHPPFKILQGQRPSNMTVESFERTYRRYFRLSDFRAVTAHLPTYMIYDDHEIKNDWGGYLFSKKHALARAA